MEGVKKRDGYSRAFAVLESIVLLDIKLPTCMFLVRIDSFFETFENRKVK